MSDDDRSVPATGPDVPYETVAPNARVWTDKAFEMLRAGSLSAAITKRREVVTASVTGSCPRCTHDVGFTRILDATAGEHVRSFRTERMTYGKATYVEFIASCMCSELHKSRPDGVSFGCGINFVVDVRPGPEADV